MHAPLTGPYARTERRAILASVVLIGVGKCVEHVDDLAQLADHLAQHAASGAVASMALVAFAGGIGGVLDRRRAHKKAREEAARSSAAVTELMMEDLESLRQECERWRRAVASAARNSGEA